jgi:hypothetical protein
VEYPVFHGKYLSEHKEMFRLIMATQFDAEANVVFNICGLCSPPDGNEHLSPEVDAVAKSSVPRAISSIRWVCKVIECRSGDAK